MNPILRRDRRGIAAVEFALLLPVILLLLVGMAEAAAHLRAWYRLEQAATATAGAAARAEALSRDAVAGLFEVAKASATPFVAWTGPGDTVRARTIVSVVSNPGTGNVLSWSCARGAADPAGAVATTAALPAGFVVPQGQSVVVVEVVNATAPWRILASPAFLGTVGPPRIRTFAVARPRAAELSTLSGGCP